MSDPRILSKAQLDQVRAWTLHGWSPGSNGQKLLAHIDAITEEVAHHKFREGELEVKINQLEMAARTSIRIGALTVPCNREGVEMLAKEWRSLASQTIQIEEENEILRASQADYTILKSRLDALNDAAGGEDVLALIEAAKEMRDVIEEAMEPGVFGEWRTQEDPALKDSPLLSLCQQFGFGAVIHHVEWLWKTHGSHPGSEHSVAACASVRRSWLKRAEAALASKEA